MPAISLSQLESYLWGAAVLLRGMIDAGDYKQFIFPLLFYKRRCDVFDEETVTALRESGGDQDFALFPENHRFQVPADAHWREIRKVSRDVGRALQQAMRDIETANPDKLFGIFGDAQWTNKDRLSDAMLSDLIEHFSTLELTVANLPEDELGQGYEYLIKKFADDSGHTAAEFYTNRTVVHLMTEMLDVQPGESVYDPTCGSGGMLLSCIAHLRNQKKEWRNVKLYGQERNLMTSSIARMNCFLHGIEDFRIERGDTLAEPKLVEGDRLMRFDVVLANPPYSIKQWDRDAFASDPWGRNLYGTPPGPPSRCSTARAGSACGLGMWWRTVQRLAIRRTRGWSGLWRWSICSRGRCMCGAGGMWGMGRRSPGGAGRGRFCSGNGGRISGRWRWRSSRRWCRATSMCSRRRMTVCCLNSCLSSASRSGSSSTRSARPPVRSRPAPTGAASPASSSTSRRATSSAVSQKSSGRWMPLWRRGKTHTKRPAKQSTFCVMKRFMVETGLQVGPRSEWSMSPK